MITGAQSVIYSTNPAAGGGTLGIYQPHARPKAMGAGKAAGTSKKGKKKANRKERAR